MTPIPTISLRLHGHAAGILQTGREGLVFLSGHALLLVLAALLADHRPLLLLLVFLLPRSPNSMNVPFLFQKDERPFFRSAVAFQLRFTPSKYAGNFRCGIHFIASPLPECNETKSHRHELECR